VSTSPAKAASASTSAAAMPPSFIGSNEETAAAPATCERPSNEGRRSPQTRLASGLAVTIVVTSGPVSKVQIPVGGASSKDASTPIEITYRRTSAREGQDGDRQGNRGPGTH
jgi:hypothetical protein